MNYSTKAKSIQQHPLFNAAHKHAMNLALHSGNTSLTYSELYSQSTQRAIGLSHRGVKPGEIIALGDQPHIEMIISIWACTLGGYVAFPLNTRFPKTSIAKIITDVNPALIIADAAIPGHTTVTSSELNAEASQVSEENLPPFEKFDAASLLMTSGSSGDVKFVQHSHHNHIASAKGSNQNIHLSASDSWLLSLPLYHVGGLSILFRTALTGAAVIVPDEKDSFLMEIKRTGVTHLSLVATQLQRFLRDQSSLEILQGMHAILLGGSAIPQPLIQDSLNLGIPLHTSYGSTEMASQITTTTKDNRQATLSSSGIVLPGRDLIISHEGEILVRGETLAQGYLCNSTLTDLRDNEGWFHTGDVGYINVQGELTVTGRMDNQFISGGENIQPEHIERILCKIPGIINAIVIPKKDVEFGARPVAFLETESSSPDEGKISHHLRNQLPGYMIPVAYFELPRELKDDKLKISRSRLAHYLNAGNKHLQAL